jgi:hypothetical protein
MTKFARLAMGFALAASLVTFSGSVGQAASKERLLDNAVDTIESVRHSPNFGDARRAMRQAGPS